MLSFSCLQNCMHSTVPAHNEIDMNKSQNKWYVLVHLSYWSRKIFRYMYTYVYTEIEMSISAFIVFFQCTLRTGFLVCMDIFFVRNNGISWYIGTCYGLELPEDCVCVWSSYLASVQGPGKLASEDVNYITQAHNDHRLLLMEIMNPTLTMFQRCFNLWEKYSTPLI